MELFDILQTAEEVSGIDMKAVLQAMGISVNVKEHTEQEQALICSFVSISSPFLHGGWIMTIL